MHRYKQHAFTLIELMVVVAIIGILAAIAFPSYSSFILRSHRTDAYVSLSKLLQTQEKYRANNTSYGTISQLGLGADSGYLSENGYYRITLLPSIGSNGFVAQATAQGAQTKDSECKVIELMLNNANTIQTPSKCWAK
ncbi:type IV pilin protein [Iodobacter sp. CM08]|uniref:type IV pilin protein n=1 Tax=Iodobacter sp. CM08 TaxID=3085902 RepID=UPI002981089C|nr:type IV pilin protein [Iodobacter sp. CM08]MDW5416847.1 type IV pilin protein [Iodobacter sp. CM08]